MQSVGLLEASQTNSAGTFLHSRYTQTDTIVYFFCFWLLIIDQKGFSRVKTNSDSESGCMKGTDGSHSDREESYSMTSFFY